MQHKHYIGFLLFILLPFGAYCDGFDLGHDFSLGIEGVNLFKGFIPSGGDISVTYSGFKLYDQGITKLKLTIGGAYDDAYLMRDVYNGDPWMAKPSSRYFHMPNARWELAFIQGLMLRDDQKNLIEAFISYRGQYNYYKTSPWPDTVFKDIRGFFGTSFLLGFSYDDVKTEMHQYKHGVFAEVSSEWAPFFLNNKIDFWRVSGQLRGFLPLYDFPTDGINLFNIYLAGFYGIDYANGKSVPIYVDQSFGGRKLRGSLGSSVRGYGSYRYDSMLKTVANLEIRFVGPAFGIDRIVPILFGFFDAGYYYGFNSSTNYNKAGGFLASSGGGLAIELFGFAQLGIVLGGRIITNNPVSYYYDNKNFFWEIQLFMHF